MHPEQQKWDRIYSNRSPAALHASEVLLENQHLLPEQGEALDLACGLGANSMLLAEHGLSVRSWDISSVAIQQLTKAASERSFNIQAEIRDVIAQPPTANSVDVLVVSHFLVREMAEVLVQALMPGGLLFYQTYCRAKVFEQGPNNPDYLLRDNELLTMFGSLKVRVYREESLLGQHERGWRNQAMLVAEKI